VKGISGKLIAWLVSLSLLIILVVGAMEYHAGTLVIERQLERSMETISNRLSVSLHNSVFAFDARTAKDIILGEFPSSDVYAILVWTQNRQRLLTGIGRSGSKLVDIVKAPDDSNLLQKTIYIAHENPSSQISTMVGEIDIYIDRSIQETRLIDSLIINLSKFTLIIIILLGIFELVVTKFLVKPLEQIYAHIHQTGSGKSGSIIQEAENVGGFSELQELDDTYQSMLNTLKSRQHELSESEHNYREIFNATNDSILLFNAETGHVIDANSAMLNMFCYPSHQDFFNSKDRRKFFKFLNLSSDQGKEKITAAIHHGPQVFECEATNIRGDRFWVEVSLLSSEIGGKNSVLAVIRDITKRKQYEEALQYNQKVLEERVALRTRELEIKNKELESFSYMVSHDLRAPLRSIDGFCQILKEDYEVVLDDQGKEYLNSVRSASQRMGILIDDLLQLSRVSRHELNVTSVDLSGLVNMTVEKFMQTYKKKKINVTIQRDVITEGDEVLLQVVMENLIGNAIKYSSTRDNPQVEFGVQHNGQESVFFVKDNGVGFDMAYVNKIFMPFQRLHGSEFEGTGIGLASVKTIIEHHQGRVWADSRQGVGSTFYFTLKSSNESSQQQSHQL